MIRSGNPENPMTITRSAETGKLLEEALKRGGYGSADEAVHAGCKH